MNPQVKTLLRLVRSGIETNVKAAIRAMELADKKDFEVLRKRIEEVRKTELVVLKKGLTEIRKSLNRVEAFRPYVAAVDAGIRAVRKQKAAKRVPRKKRRTK